MCTIQHSTQGTEQPILKRSVRMKSKLRKINRGVILSTILIICIVGLYAGIGIKAAPEKNLMNEKITGFFEVLNTAFIVPEEYLKDNVTEAEVNKLIFEIRASFKPYFSTETALDVFINGTVKNQIENQTIYHNTLIKSYSSDYKKITDIKIDYKKLTAKTTVTYHHKSERVYYDLVYNEDGSVSKSNSSTNNNGNGWDLNMTVSMEKIDGNWFITAVSQYWI